MERIGLGLPRPALRPRVLRDQGQGAPQIIEIALDRPDRDLVTGSLELLQERVGIDLERLARHMA
ncbi:hypothetical protein SOM61_22370 [Massilia sp. CFBP9012]|uniref:hypothetical protein n=1 Tax=Massilia sp. CFBP9012 TaxID=3096531 RepID=UPI002A6A80F8|nr:hypothetical protein [Massilia sp. CFBP9012]MDY0977711.1 hypothetical protein [Massilia sp. CFBP9012]